MKPSEQCCDSLEWEWFSNDLEAGIWCKNCGRFASRTQVVAILNKVAQLEEGLGFRKRYMDDMEIVLNGDGNHSKEFTQVFRVAKLKAENAKLKREMKPFPMQDGPPIPRKTAEMVYEMYSNLYGSDQSLDRMAERAGFGWVEIPFMRKELIRRRGADVYARMRKGWFDALLIAEEQDDETRRPPF